MFHMRTKTMLILRCSSSASSIHELVKLAAGMLVLKPDAARTKKELEFAFFLADQEFAQGTNISGKLSNEAMLFLANETNFSSAARKAGAKSCRDFVLISKENVPIGKLKRVLLLTRVKKLDLPEWGKKKEEYYDWELAVERMALSRIRN